MTQQTEQRYIVTDDAILGGEPVVDGTRPPMRAIVELWHQGVTRLKPSRRTSRTSPWHRSSPR